MATKAKQLMAAKASLLSLTLLFSSSVQAHGDVAPQPVNTDALPDIGEDWLEENPYRSGDEETWLNAIRIGASGYNQNCARCHGLGAVSGGLAPDVRYLEADIDGDEWYLERYINGYTQNGITKMPAFGDLLGQKAAWAIRTYIETRPDDGALDDFNDTLSAIRDDLNVKADAIKSGQAEASDYAEEVMTYKAQLEEIASQIETGSGAEKAHSIALEAGLILGSDEGALHEAAETLTIGLSAAN